jgi:hypothetical protein
MLSILITLALNGFIQPAEGNCYGNNKLPSILTSDSSVNGTGLKFSVLTSTLMHSNNQRMWVGGGTKDSRLHDHSSSEVVGFVGYFDL